MLWSVPQFHQLIKFSDDEDLVSEDRDLGGMENRADGRWQEDLTTS